MNLKQRRKQRIINEIAMLESMDNKLWLQLWFSAFICIIFIAFILYSFASNHVNSGKLFIVAFILYLGAIIMIGKVYKTKLWRYSYVPLFAFVLLLGILFGGSDLGFGVTPSDMDGKRKEKRYTMNREELVEKALAKRRALLERL